MRRSRRRCVRRENDKEVKERGYTGKENEQRKKRAGSEKSNNLDARERRKKRWRERERDNMMK